MAEPASSSHLISVSSYVWQLAAIGVCLALLAFTSLSEAALMRVELGRARQLAQEGRRGARGLVRLVERRQEVLSNLVLVINLCIIIASAYTTEVTIGLSLGSTRWVPVSSVGMILVILILCEVTPKTYAVRRAEAVGLLAGPLLNAFDRVVSPVGRFLYLIAIWLIRHAVVPLIGGRVTPARPRYSDEEVMALVAEGEAEGDIEEEEKEMIHGVIEFADKVAREVMTPRTDMVCVSGDSSLLEAARISEETGFSRLPVYEENVDHIIGILYVKDMLSAVQTGRSELAARQVARKPPPLVPESKKLTEVLNLMQRHRLHMAIVIDEYGGTAGLVAIEDLLEEIFGEIQDEHDFEAEPVRVVDETTLVLDARVSTDEVKDRLGITIPEGDFDSVGGFILDQLGRLPVAGEKLTWRNTDFIVEEVSENRIQRVRVILQPVEEGQLGPSDGEEQEGEQG
jgi:putative hemolysin